MALVPVQLSLKQIKRIKDAFDVFDHKGDGAIHSRELGTVLRSLEMFPTQADVHELLFELTNGVNPAWVQWLRFEPVCIRLLQSDRFPRFPSEKVLAAYKTLDSHSKGYLSSDELIHMIKTRGEVFDEDEVGEMVSAASDPESRRIYYEDFLSSIDDLLG